jgi:putative endonuclease
MRQYYVYILTNRSRTLYTGMTNDLVQRVHQHRQKLVPGFTSRYDITQLAYAEAFESAISAIAREKQIKGWLRKRKIELIESMNPNWRDLSDDWREDEQDPSLALRMTVLRRVLAQGDSDESTEPPNGDVQKVKA